MNHKEQLQDLQFRAESVLRQYKASREIHCKIDGDRASEVTAEYLLRQVPEEDLPRFVSQPRREDGPEHTTPLETLAGFAVLALVAFIFGVLL